jgi:hypothetical protein
MRGSKLTRTMGPAVAGTAAFLAGYEYLGVSCSSLFGPPTCSNALGWPIAPAADFRPTWFAAALIAVGAWWAARLLLDPVGRRGVRPRVLGAAVLCGGVPLAVMWWRPGLGALATAAALGCAGGPFGLGLALRRPAGAGPWKDLAVRGVLATAGAGALATEAVVWGTHSVWGAIRTPHLWVPVPFFVPALAMAALCLLWGRSVGARRVPEAGGREVRAAPVPVASSSR